MKKFRFLTVVVLAISMLFAVASAAVSSFDPVTYDGAADTLEVVLKVEEAAASFDMYNTMQIKFDENVLAIDTAACTSDYAMTFYDYTGDMGYGAVAFSNEGGNLVLTKGAVFAKLVFNVVDKAAVAGTVIEWDVDNSYAADAGAMLELAGSVTVEAAETKPELKLTYKLGNTTYTDVPNITVKKNLTSANISGKVLIDYEEDGVAAATAAEKAFSAVIGKFTGTPGEVSFDVALINVPSNITVTGMNVKLD